MKKRYTQWTKDEMKTLFQLWESKDMDDIMDELNRSKEQIRTMRNRMVKMGFDLPQKHRVNYIQNLLNEVKKELKIK